MAKGVRVVLPHGFTTDGKNWLRSIYVKELDGYDELYLSNLYYQQLQLQKHQEQNQQQRQGKVDQIHGTLSSFHRMIDLLIRITIIERISAYTNQETAMSINVKKGKIAKERNDTNSKRELLIGLTVGDRSALLFQFQMLMFGDVMNCEMSCPLCHEIVSLDIRASELLLPQISNPQREYDVVVDNFELTLRPINGKDQEVLLSRSKNLMHNDIRASISYVIKLCVLSSNPPLPEDLSLNEELLEKLSAKLGELDPQADIVLDMKCPYCMNSSKISFFIEDYILQQISPRLDQLDNEIHLIASNYHWSEDDILSLPMRRRKRYVELITENNARDIEE